MLNVGELSVGLGLDTKPFDKELAGVERKASGMGDSIKKMAGAAGGALLAGGVAAFGMELMNTGTMLEGIAQKSKVVFESMSGDMRTWADANNEALGLTDDQLLGLAANFGDLMKPMGFTAEEAANMSKEVIGLAGALSSWSGGTKSAAEVSDILAKAMLGETDGLKALGIAISAAEVDAKALAMGLGTVAAASEGEVKAATLGLEKAQKAASEATKEHGKNSLEAREAQLKLEEAEAKLAETMAGGKVEIDEQAKALATQQLIMEKSTDAQTAWAEGGNKAMVAQNKIKAIIAEVKEDLAAKLMPVMMDVANWMGEKLPHAVDAVKEKYEQVRPVLEFVVSTLKDVILWFNEHRKVLMTVVTAIGVLFAVQKAHAAFMAVQAVGGLIKYIAQMNIVQMVTKTWTAVQWLLNAALSANPIGLVVLAIAALVAALVLAWQHSDTFREIVTGAFGKVKEIAEGVFNWIKDNWPLLLAILTGPFGLAVLAIVRNWDTIKDKAGAVKDFISDRVDDIVGFFTGLPGRISSAVQGAFDGVTGAFRTAINALIGIWNKAAEVMRIDFDFEAPDWVPVVGGKGFSFHQGMLPTITPLAKGGIALGPTLAMIGEGGESEVVAPLSRLASMLDSAYGAGMRAALGGGGVGVMGSAGGGGRGDTIFQFPNYVGNRSELRREMTAAAAMERAKRKAPGV